MNDAGIGLSVVRGTMCVLAVSCIGGCQTYSPKPLDLDAHLRSYLDRPVGPTMNADRDSRDFNLEDGLGIDEAEAMALVFNIELRMARLRAGITRAGAEHAGLWEDPRLGVDLTRIIQSTPEPWKVFTTIGLTIPISGRLEVERQLAGAAHAAELARVVDAEWQVRYQLRRDWIGWSMSDRRRVAQQEYVSALEQIVAVIAPVEEAGGVSRIDARLFHIELAHAQVQLADFEFDELDARMNLLSLMGLRPDCSCVLLPVQLNEGSFDESALQIDTERLLKHPRMEVAKAEYAIAEDALELAIRQQYPDLQIGPGYGREDGRDQVLLDLSVPIPILNANRRQIEEARARRELAAVSAETQSERLYAEAMIARARYLSRRTLRTQHQGRLQSLIQDQIRDLEALAALGQRNALVLLDSVMRRRQADLDLIAAMGTEASAYLEFVMLTDGSLTGEVK